VRVAGIYRKTKFGSLTHMDSVIMAISGIG
jgi:hypothetical protein